MVITRKKNINAVALTSLSNYRSMTTSSRDLAQTLTHMHTYNLKSVPSDKRPDKIGVLVGQVIEGHQCSHNK